MSDQMTRLVVAGVLLVHGLGHAGALGALAWIGLRGGDTGAWLPARSWLLPSMPSGTATAIASIFWIVSLVGFVVAAGALWFGVGDWWRGVAFVSALVSTVGIVLFFGTWPIFNTVAALGVDVAVIVALLVLRWPPQTV
jgi:hypothetical protein